MVNLDSNINRYFHTHLFFMNDHVNGISEVSINITKISTKMSFHIMYKNFFFSRPVYSWYIEEILVYGWYKTVLVLELCVKIVEWLKIVHFGVQIAFHKNLAHEQCMADNKSCTELHTDFVCCCVLYNIIHCPWGHEFD